MDAPKTLQHKPTDDIISKSLEMAAKIHGQERLVEGLHELIDGRWDDKGEEYVPGLNAETAEIEKTIARMERDLLAQKQWLATKLQASAEINARIAEGERLLAQYHREYTEILTSALKGFPV